VNTSGGGVNAVFRRNLQSAVNQDRLSAALSGLNEPLRADPQPARRGDPQYYEGLLEPVSKKRRLTVQAGSASEDGRKLVRCGKEQVKFRHIWAYGPLSTTARGDLVAGLVDTGLGDFSFSLNRVNNGGIEATFKKYLQRTIMSKSATPMETLMRLSKLLFTGDFFHFDFLT
jgi:hypothetical protein